MKDPIISSKNNRRKFREHVNKLKPGTLVVPRFNIVKLYQDENLQTWSGYMPIDSVAVIIDHIPLTTSLYGGFTEYKIFINNKFVKGNLFWVHDFELKRIR